MQAQACGNLAEAIDTLANHVCDVILLDYDLGPEHRSGTWWPLMKERGLPGRILVVTAGLTGRQAMDLMQQGVAGIFPKTDSPQSLVEAIRKVNAGEAWFKQDHLQLLVQNLSEPGANG